MNDPDLDNELINNTIVIEIDEFEIAADASYDLIQEVVYKEINQHCQNIFNNIKAGSFNTIEQISKTVSQEVSSVIGSNSTVGS